MGLNILQSIKRVGLVLALATVSAFAAADLPRHGTVYQWGHTSAGTGMRYVVACGNTTYGDVDHNVTILTDGSVRVDNVPTGVTGAVALSVGMRDAMILKCDGTVVVIPIGGGSHYTVPDGLTDVVAISAGEDTFVAVKSDGSLVAWGDNRYGQLAMPPADPANPVIKVCSIHAGTFFLHKDGKVTCQGDRGELGSLLDIPADLPPADDISVGRYCGMIKYTLNFDWGANPGNIQCWGPDAAERQPKLSYGQCESFLSGENYSLVVDRFGSLFIVSRKSVPDDGIEELPRIQNPGMLGGGVSSRSPMLVMEGFDGTISANSNTMIGGSSSGVTVTIKVDDVLPEDRNFTVYGVASGQDPDPKIYPQSVTLPAGKQSVTVKLLADLPGSAQLETIFVNSVWQPLAISVLPMSISGLTFKPSTVEGGQVTTGTLTLIAPSAGLYVTIISNSPSAPVSGKYIPQGSRSVTFPVNTRTVSTTTVVDVLAWVGNSTRLTTLTVNPRPVLQSVSLASSMYGNQKITGTVKLALAAGSAGATVTVNGGGLTVPATISIPAGSKTGTFAVTADDPSVTTLHHLTFSTATSSVGKDLTVKPNPLTGLTLSAPSVQGGTTVSGTVTLSRQVDVDTVVTVSASTSAEASFPTIVIVPAYASSVTFDIQTNVVTSTKRVTLTVTKNTSTKKVVLSVTK